jgi:hypothetical protein
MRKFLRNNERCLFMAMKLISIVFLLGVLLILILNGS